jgi:hypothetical protein
MPWVRLDDRFPSHRKVALLSDRAFRLHVSALCWASENLTEGKILESELRVIAHVRGAKTAAKELEDRQLWDRVAGGWVIHDFLEYNPDRAKVQAEREANAARQQAWRDRKKAEKEAKAAAEKAVRDAMRNGVTDHASEPSSDTNATATRHEDDTNSKKDTPAKNASPQVGEIRNAVNNGTPSPAPSPTSSSYGRTAASSSNPAATGGVPNALQPLRTALAEAGLGAVAWDIKKFTDWERIRIQVDRLGIPVMVRSASLAAERRGEPDSVTAWIGRWESLADTPADSNGEVVPLRQATNRQQQETDDLFGRAMQRAQARMQQEGTAG